MISGKNDILTHLKLVFSKERTEGNGYDIADFFPSLVYVFDADKKNFSI